MSFNKAPSPIEDRDIKILESRHAQPDIKDYFDGLSVRYYKSESGNIFARYQLTENQSSPVNEQKVVLAIPGGRNPYCGDYFPYIKRVLGNSENKVTDFITMYFPFGDTPDAEGMIINPNALANDLENINQLTELSPDRQLHLVGFCISADELIYGLHHGLADRCPIDSMLLISPSGLYEEGKKEIKKRYLPFLVDEKMRTRILQRFIAMFHSVAYECPDNINTIARTIDTTLTALDQINETPPTPTGRKVPYINTVWPDLDLIPDDLKLRLAQRLTQFAHKGINGIRAISGSHGASTTEENYESYLEAIISIL